MKLKRWIAIRGLVRGNEHWGDFPDVLKQLDPSIDLELLEIPGNGTRFDEQTPINVEAVISAIKERSRIARSKESYNILGISLAGLIALKWAELFPKELESIVLVNSSLPGISPFYRRLQYKQYFNILRALTLKDFTKREMLILQMTSNNSERAKFFLNKFANFSERYPVRYQNLIRQLLLANQVKLAGESGVKTKIICSTHDNLVHSSCSNSLAKKLGLQVINHPTAGHDLPLDDPNWLARQILQIETTKTLS